jgi:glucose/mannose-6-phosphate isomerase
VQARYEVVPELCHNEIESFRHASFNHPSLKVAVVMMRNEVESRLETTLLDVLKEALEKAGIDSLYEVWGEGGTLESILTSVYFIDYLTYYLAILKGVDPSPVTSIEAFKEMLREKM